MGYWNGDARCVTINIVLRTGVGEYELPDKSILSNCAHWVSIAHRTPAGSRKTRTGANLVNANCFKAAHLTLRDNVSSEFLRQIPLELTEIRTGTEGYGLRLPENTIDLANSKIFIADTAAIVDGEEIELIVFYKD
jgi:hypothetical protein